MFIAFIDKVDIAAVVSSSSHLQDITLACRWYRGPLSSWCRIVIIAVKPIWNVAVFGCVLVNSLSASLLQTLASVLAPH
jgi:hypothetical protein